jgi:hypothetical protein
VVFPLDRAWAVVFRPRAAWNAIAESPTSPSALLLGYALPLASIGAAATFVALHVVGIPFRHGVRYTSVGTASVEAGLSLATALVGVPVMAGVATLLAPLFETRPDFMKALRVTVFSLTPAWLGGIFLAYAPIGSLQLLAALYGIWELYLGLGRVMGAPERRAPMFAVVTAVVSLLAGFGIGVLLGMIGATLRSAA